MSYQVPENYEFSFSPGTEIPAMALAEYLADTTTSSVLNLWVSFDTLLRNAQGWLAKESQSPEALAEQVLTDFMGLKTITGMHVTLYSTSPKFILSMVPKAGAKEKTPKQLEQLRLAGKAWKVFCDNPNYPEVKVIHGKVSEGYDVILLTHKPVDYLMHYGFSSLLLVESHTGVIKNRSVWGNKLLTTKMQKEKYSGHVPAIALSYAILGDGNKDLVGASRKLRSTYLDAGVDFKWTYLTTKDKVRNDMVKRIEELQDLELLKEFYAML